MSKPTETDAFIYNIRVSWADCDPAYIAYTARFPYWALESMDAWWEHYTGINWYALNVDRGIGTPFVHMNLDFRSPVTPRHMLECKVQLIHLGEKSIRHRVIGRQNGVLCFQGEFVSVFVETKSLKSRKPPQDLVDVFETLQHVEPD